MLAHTESKESCFVERRTERRAHGIPRHNPVNAFTMGGIVRDAGLTANEFRKLLEQPANGR